MTTETTYFASVAAIKSKLKLSFPLNIKLPDPVTGEDWTVVRDDIYNLLLSDPSQLLLEGQTVAALYLEAARMQRACSRAANKADVAYRQWRSQIANAFVAAEKAENDGKKPPDKSIEAHYRAHQHYEHYSSVPDFYKNLANLFSDMKEAFKLKAKMIDSAGHLMAGYEQTVRVERHEEGDDLERLDEMAAASIAEGRASTSTASTSEPPPAADPPPTEEAEEEEEEEVAEVDEDGRVILADEEVCGTCEENPCECPIEGEGEEDEESVPPPPPEEEEDPEEDPEDGDDDGDSEPPPPPPKKKSKRKPGKPGKRDGKGNKKKSTSKKRSTNK